MIQLAALPKRLFHRLIRGGAVASRDRRYSRTFIAGAFCIWGFAIAYLVLIPKSYTSSFTFILPGTGVGSSVNLQSLGQASTLSASAYSTPDVSPTENYRKMLLSHRVLKATAASVGLAETSFPAPKIELAEQTKLIIVSLQAPSAKLAQERTEALRSTFLSTLDSLRNEEIATRDASTMDMMQNYRSTLDKARNGLIKQQVKTGLVSLEQYNSMVAGLDHLRESLRDIEVKVAQAHGGVVALMHTLNTTPDDADLAMMLRSDPIFQTALEQLSKDDSDIAGLYGTRGEANAKLADLLAARNSLAAALLQRSAELTGKRRSNILRMPDLSLHEERAQLFARLINDIADQASYEGMRNRVQSQIDSEGTRVMALAQDASRLDGLKGDVQVAEAVFSSALARVGTSKADFFASYPLVQTLELPILPEHPSSPSKGLALAGAFGATVFLTLALVMTWLRTELLRKLLRSDLSSTPSPSAGFGISWAHST